MTSATFEPLGPVLVSELPPVDVRPGLLARVRAALALRFERALRLAGPNEHSDLLAAARRG